MGFFGVLTMIGAGISVWLLLAALAVKGAAQEAALAAYALAITLIPYAVFRVLQIRQETERRTVFELKVLKAIERAEAAQEQGRAEQ